MTKVAILGGSGYTAVELIKILLRHPHTTIEAVCSRQEAATKIADLHPSLYGRLDLACEPFDAAELKRRGVRCVFGCLPHGVSAECVKPLLEQDLRVVDLSADYRLRSAAVFSQWYGIEHHDTANLAHAVYGIPEIHGSKLSGARLVANPGCYPQTAILGLAPLVANDLIETSGIIVNSASGVSGAGRTPKLSAHFPECNENFVAYNVGKHRHTPEIEQGLADVAGKPVDVIFTPHLLPMDRGILSTIYATPTKAVNEADLLAIYRRHFALSPFVRVRDNLPATKDVAYSNFLDVTVRVVKNKIVVFSAIDNLIRGASGVAVQNFNLMFGYDERAGLL